MASVAASLFLFQTYFLPMEDHLFAKVQQSADCLDDAGDPRRSDDEQSNVDERHNVQVR